MSTRYGDTSEAAARAQILAYRRLSDDERLALAVEMSRTARSFAEAGIREEHPDWSDRSVHRELLRMAFYPQPLPSNLE